MHGIHPEFANDGVLGNQDKERRFSKEKARKMRSLAIQHHILTSYSLLTINGELEMANWRHTLNFGLWYHDDDINLKQKAEGVAKELKKIIGKFNDDDLEIIAEDFSDFPEDGNVLDFDAIMSELYDWSDQNLVWIETH